jgi:hypothetical protein
MRTSTLQSVPFRPLEKVERAIRRRIAGQDLSVLVQANIDRLRGRV